MKLQGWVETWWDSSYLFDLTRS